MDSRQPPLPVEQVVPLADLLDGADLAISCPDGKQQHTTDAEARYTRAWSKLWRKRLRRWFSAG